MAKTKTKVNIKVADNKSATATVAEKKETKEVLNPTQLRQQEAKKLRAANKAKAEKLAKVEADKKADQAATAEKASKTAEKDTRKVFTDDKKQQYRFKKSAPKTLNIDGVSTSIDDIIEDEEIMLELVNGNSNYIEKIYN